ncbi:MAG: DUF5657 family protein [Candidatus Shapirobacteria bacterium]
MTEIKRWLELVEKICVIIGTLVYLVFAVVIVRQVNSMSKIVHDKFNLILIVFSYFHLAFAILLLILAILLL